MPTSRELVDRARRGDRDSFAELVPEAVARLRGAAYRILGNAADADDAVQEALITAWRRLPTLRDIDRFEAWTYRLTVRACLRAARNERTRRAPLRALRGDGTWQGDSIGEIEQRDALDWAFAQLPVRHRAVVVLHHYVGMPLTEVADVLEIPHGTARSRLHYALMTMRRLLTTGEAQRKGRRVG